MALSQQMKKKFWVCNQVDTTTAEILLYGYIGQYEEIDDAAFVMDLRILESQYSTINMRVNCGGGDVYQGLTIFNAIRNSKAKIIGWIDGIAASMGTVVVSGCSEVHMSKYGRYMTHRVRGFAGGNADQLRTYADEMEQLEDNISAILAKRTGLSKEDAKAKYITEKDRWIGADQALTEKLIDTIYDAEPVSLPADNSVEKAFSAFQQQFQNRLYNQTENMKEIALSLGLPENATEAQITAAINKLKADKKTAEDSALAALKANAKALVSKAILEGKFVEGEREQLEADALANYDGTKRMIDKIPPSKKPSKLLNLENKSNGEEDDDPTEVKDWESLIAKGEAFVANFKKENATQYNTLLAAYTNKAPEAKS